jgi:hypothetical protein
LNSLLNEDRTLNSIDILIPFMKETNFKKLTITCSHLPKWFNKVIADFGLVGAIEEPKPDLLIVTVSPINPDEDISFRKNIRVPAMGGCSSGGC